MGNRKSEIPGTLELWNFGTLELWNPGTLEPLNPGTFSLAIRNIFKQYAEMRLGCCWVKSTTSPNFLCCWAIGKRECSIQGSTKP